MYLVILLIKYVSKDRKEICDDFKTVYQANSKEEASTFLSCMVEKWQKTYPKVTQSLIENQDGSVAKF